MDIAVGLLYSASLVVYIIFVYQKLLRKKNSINVMYGRETIVTETEIFDEMKSKLPLPSIGFLLIIWLAASTFAMLRGRDASNDILNTAFNTLFTILTWRFFIIILFAPIVLIGVVIAVGFASGKFKVHKGD